MSDSSTGTPPCWVRTMLAISSSERIAPTPRTLTDCSPIESVRPPTLALLVEIDLGLELLGLAAEHQNVGHTRHDPQPALHHPVLQRLELHDVHAGRALE